MQNDSTKSALEARVNKGVQAVRRMRVQWWMESLLLRGLHCFGKEIQDRKRLQLHFNKPPPMSVIYLFSMSSDNNTFLSHNLKHFSCQCEWMSTLHTSPWLWVVEYSSYSMWNVFQLKIYMEARFYQMNISICQKSKPRKSTTPMKMPLNSGVYYSFHSHLGIWVILSRINHKSYAVSFYTV